MAKPGVDMKRDKRRFAKHTYGSRKVRTPRSLLPGLLKTQDNACIYCAQPFKGLRTPVLDHVLPIAAGGKNTKMNLVAACITCNAWKSDKVFESLSHAQNYLLDRWLAVTPDRR